MKNIILLIALIFSTTSMAQELQRRSTTIQQKVENIDLRVERELKGFTESLQLTPEQQSKAKVLLEKNARLQAEKGGKDEYDAGLEKEFRVILTPEQNKKLDELKAQAVPSKSIKVKPVQSQRVN